MVGYGRLDILVRVALAALYPAGVIDELVQLLAVLDAGNGLEAILLDKLCLPDSASYEHELGPYILEAVRGERCKRWRLAGMSELVSLLREAGYRVILLREWGHPFSGYAPYTAYILGMHEDPPSGVGEDAVESVGPRSYLASHVVAFIRLAQILPSKWVMRVKSGLRPAGGPMG